MAKDYIEDALEALNVGATNLDQKTVAQINSMNIELKNADGSLAGRYTLSSFLENIIYTFLSTTKASPLASVLGGLLLRKGGTKIESNTDLDSLTNDSFYYCDSKSVAESLTHAPSMSAGFNMIVFSPYGVTPNSIQLIIYKKTFYIRYNGSGGTWSEWGAITAS